MSFWRHVLPVGIGIGIILLAGLLVMISGPKDLSDDAVAGLVAAALGVFGTHAGHVSGHFLGRASREDKGASSDRG